VIRIKNIWLAYIVAFAAFTGFSLQAMAQEEVFVPHQPLLPRAPEMAAWTITYQYGPKSTDHPSAPNEKNGQPPPPEGLTKSVDIQKTKDIYHVVTHLKDATSSEFWIFANRLFYRDPRATKFEHLSNVDSTTIDFSKSDFPEIYWLNMKYYLGIKKDRTSTFVFQITSAERPLTAREQNSINMLKAVTHPEDLKRYLQQQPRKGNCLAFLDVTTQLPVAYDDGSVVLLYQFLPPPTKMLTPPAEILALCRRLDDLPGAAAPGLSSH
jgi:hypothetical protein